MNGIISTVEYDDRTKTGAIVIRIPFERPRSKEEYAHLYGAALAWGATEDEARQYAGHLDHMKPSAAIAKAREVAPSLLSRWEDYLERAIRNSRGAA